VGIVFGGAVGLHLLGIVDGRFDPQQRLLFVVHLDRVAIEGVLDACALGADSQI